jgi:hypothetical protein
MGLVPYPVPTPEENRVERAATPIPEQAEQEMWSGESTAWDPRSVTPDGEADTEGRKSISSKGEGRLTAIADFPDLFQPDLIDKMIEVTVCDLDHVNCSAYITGLGHNEDFAKVFIRSKGEIVVPRHHVRVRRPAGRGNKVVITKGEDTGRVGKVDSTAVKYGGKWIVREHSTNKMVMASKTDMALVNLVLT